MDLDFLLWGPGPAWGPGHDLKEAGGRRDSIRGPAAQLTAVRKHSLGWHLPPQPLDWRGVVDGIKVEHDALGVLDHVLEAGQVGAHCLACQLARERAAGAPRWGRSRLSFVGRT